jgi:16S rRNA G527 N7-methylase RsmG
MEDVTSKQAAQAEKLQQYSDILLKENELIN